jgi:hypothetical protein
MFVLKMIKPDLPNFWTLYFWTAIEIRAVLLGVSINRGCELFAGGQKNPVFRKKYILSTKIGAGFVYWDPLETLAAPIYANPPAGLHESG